MASSAVGEVGARRAHCLLHHRGDISDSGHDCILGDFVCAAFFPS